MGAPTYKGFRLSRFQLQAVEAIRAGANVLVSAPTGAGKTLVAEYAIEDAVARGKRCIYTAPIKALSNQKYRDFRDDPKIDVGLMTGDVTIHPHAQVLIMTTEILRNSIFENPAALDDVEFVIFDEVHFMDDIERGTVWEESLIFAPRAIRFVCLSATIENLDELGAWMRQLRDHELEVIRSEKRPVPLRHRFYLPDLGMFDGHKLDWAKRQARAPERGKRGKDKRGGRGGRGDWEQRRDENRRREAASFSTLLDEIQEKQLLPAMVFCFSRKDCERLALANQKRHLLDDAEYERMQGLQRELLDMFQLHDGELQGEIFRLASHGIGYHHAGMLPVHKEVVERLFTSGLLKLLFTTETFALGINMPARTAIFFGLKKFDGVNFDYLRTRDYMQMAGRAGRQGIDDEGLVVSRLEFRDLEDAPLKRLLANKPEPVNSRFRLSYSSILHLIDRIGRERLFEAWEKSFNSWQHRGGNRKARERNSREQRRLVEAHLEFLYELGYIEGEDELTAKGKIGRLLVGYELQITELLWRGALENLGAEALCVVFVALVFEERRRGEPTFVSPRLYGGVRRHIGQILTRLSAQEAHYGIPTPMKTVDWGLTPAVCAWARGASFEELEETTDATAGDLCRCFRMAIQLMRQVKRAMDPSFDLVERLDEAMAAINRDEVDARRQLELG
ncbi:DEAD/DEAH box helicase [Engelhardtia mirabilis]|uniref:Ski2-like helicase n=1 Tax=Engelhardtia mirabilis TaxID=2528011 RepID=A0A518BJ48_9BACT|nr:ski2-like helicase [Planctomycetes bacterium Pla133]QDV01312.1 ski2-like helicase [Planctomycetes bacterium Pla86]